MRSPSTIDSARRSVSSATRTIPSATWRSWSRPKREPGVYNNLVNSQSIRSDNSCGVKHLVVYSKYSLNSNSYYFRIFILRNSQSIVILKAKFSSHCPINSVNLNWIHFSISIFGPGKQDNLFKVKFAYYFVSRISI